ncbi:MAG TPA: hypothetical protein VGS07_07045 [Thermoanaerobaculia bacterium]|jgi:hypothetical protein|nr:hypothetical protein [Thermoanaerobaculia bacterium]
MHRSILVIALLLAAHLSTAAVAETDPFLEAGIPAATRPWSGPDYERTVEILTAGKVPLPKFSNPQGAALLRRMTSLDNLSLERDPNLPLSTRMPDFLQLEQAVGKLITLYGDANEGDYRSELAHITAFVLHSSALGVDLVEEFMPTLVRDETYAARMEGLKKMNEGMTTIFVSAEQMLAEENSFSEDDLSVLLDAMATTLPRLKQGFPPEVGIELRKKLVADKARFKKDEDARRLDRMIGELGPA